MAQSAGGGEASAPEAKRCREFLESVLEVCHRLVYTPEIRAEWTRHRSRFSLRWQRSMFAHRKVVSLADVTTSSVLEAIDSENPSPKERRALEKDALLVAAALASDGIVVSRDLTACAAYSKLASGHPSLAGLRWLDPTRSGEDWDGPPETWGEALGSHPARRRKH